MNRVGQNNYDISTLYIIGNGFDKAHGMLTGYGDFKSLRSSRK